MVYIVRELQAGLRSRFSGATVLDEGELIDVLGPIMLGLERGAFINEITSFGWKISPAAHRERAVAAALSIIWRAANVRVTENPSARQRMAENIQLCASLAVLKAKVS